MQTKICSQCKIEQPIENFGWRNKEKQQRNAYCKSCHLKKVKENYNKKVAKINEIKSHLCCEKCGETRPYVLDFHHKNPSEKKDTVARMIANTSNINSVLEEIAKCAVLCANCHREFHYLQKQNPDFTLDEYLYSCVAKR